MNVDYKYILVDSDNILSYISNSAKLHTMMEKCLVMINDKLMFLIKNNIRVNKLIFDNFVIVETVNGSKYPCPVYNKYYFDTTSCKFIAQNNTQVIQFSNYIINMTETIKNNLNIVLDKQQVGNNIIIGNNSNSGRGLMNSTVTKKELYDKQLLENMIIELERHKQTEINKLGKIETDHKLVVDEYTEMANNLGDDKRELRRLKEKEEESWNVFESDKGIYKKMKHQITNGTLSEKNIPELFRTKYPILKFLDEEQVLDTEDDYFMFIEMHDDINKKPELEKQSKFTKPRHPYARKKSQGKQYESLDKILAETYSDDEVEEIEEITNIEDVGDIEDGCDYETTLMDHPMFN